MIYNIGYLILVTALILTAYGTVIGFWAGIGSLISATLLTLAYLVLHFIVLGA